MIFNSARVSRERELIISNGSQFLDDIPRRNRLMISKLRRVAKSAIEPILARIIPSHSMIIIGIFA